LYPIVTTACVSGRSLDKCPWSPQLLAHALHTLGHAVPTGYGPFLTTIPLRDQESIAIDKYPSIAVTCLRFLDCDVMLVLGCSVSIVPNVICRLSTGRIHGYDRTYAFCFDGHSASEIPVICKVATVTLINYICWNVCAFLVCEVSVANSHLRITVQMPPATYYTKHCYTHQLHLLAHLCIPCLRSLNCVFSLADYRTDACCVIPYLVPVHFKVNHVHATCSP
jgi:hypothetical protein